VSDSPTFRDLLYSFLTYARLANAERMAQAHSESSYEPRLPRSEHPYRANFVLEVGLHQQKDLLFTETEHLTFVRHGSPARFLVHHESGHRSVLESNLKSTIEDFLSSSEARTLLYILPSIPDELEHWLKGPRKSRPGRRVLGPGTQPHDEPKASEHLLQQLASARGDLRAALQALVGVLSFQVEMIRLEQSTLTRGIEDYSNRLQDFALWAQSVPGSSKAGEGTPS
jgi:hypothetical protein